MSAGEGPYAFPIPYETPGMLLRDWFAGQLAAAEVASAGANYDAAQALAEAAEQAGQTIPERIAFNAYEVADAMLIVRDADFSDAPAAIIPASPSSATKCPTCGIADWNDCDCIPF